MNSNIDIINGANKMAPLISFYTIVDIDVGLIRLIKREYLNPSAFDIEFFKRPLINIIHDLYYRKMQNPIYLFAKDNIEKEKIDQYYSDFLNEKMDDILDLSVTTAMEDLIELFADSSEIIPTILCYTEEQINILNNTDKYKKYTKVLLRDLGKTMKYSYTQYYFNLISEAEYFLDAKNKSFYFSTCGRNLNEDDSDIIESSIIGSLISKSLNQVSLIDLYNKKELERK